MTFSRLILMAVLASAADFSAPAHDLTFENASPTSTLVELYTSEGCSSCPPAEEWLSGLKSSPGLWKTLFPVAFHITYWDDLGWTDPFARPAFTQRQRAYAASLGQDSVYTPEFVANGREWRGWFHGETLPPADPAMHGRLSTVVHDDGSISASCTTNETSGPLTLNIAWLAMARTSNVTAGENGGRELHHDFLALQLQSAPMTYAADTAVGRIVASHDEKGHPDALVAWISAPQRAVVQVTGGWLR